MEGLLVAAKSSIIGTVDAALAASTGQNECARLARYCVKIGLVLTELQLCLCTNEALRGSKSVFLAVDAAANALRQAEQLVQQCAGSQPSSIWPLEDAVEFQAVAAELRTAAAGLAALGDRLPQDVQQDAAHVYRQMVQLSFTPQDLKETEEQELERVQHLNRATSPVPSLPAAPLAAPPAAPAEQFEDPQEARESAALAVSQREAVAARLPLPAAAADEVEQRQALQAAAAVAVTVAAEVLSEGDEEEGAAGREEGEEEGDEEAFEEFEAVEGARALQQEMEEEAAEAEAIVSGALGVVVTPEGETAMSPMAHAKGAVPARAPSPLPCDPFEMTADTEDALGIGTLKELKNFQQGQDDLAVAAEEEIEHQLEPPADFKSLKEQQEGAGEGTGTSGEAVRALAALQQLQEYESAMGVGEEAEEAGQAEEGSMPSPRLPPAAEPQQQLAPVHKSRSECVAAVLADNLAELAQAEVAAVELEAAELAAAEAAVVQPSGTADS